MHLKNRDARPTPEPEPASAKVPVSDSGELEAAVESTAAILRARVRHSFSVGEESAREVAEEYEGWAKHLLVRSAPPGPPSERPSNTRDWRGVVDFVQRRAKKEQTWAEESVGGLRDAMFVLVESLGQASIAQGKRDAVLEEHLASLSSAIESGSVDLLKQEAMRATVAITGVIEQQRRASDAQARLLREQLAEVGQELEETRREGETDPLTRLSNRRVFDASIARSISLASAIRRPISLLMIDIDHFKKVNDTHGHPNGDRALKAVADALARAFPRRSDLVVRYGGEEFAVLCEGDAAAVARLAERLLAMVRAIRVQLDPHVLSVTVSVGLAEARPGERAEDLVERADRALYEAKHGGRDRAVIAR